ncbi:sulfate transporter 3 1 [Quillaja saponaria]|uniref:Sulfate transporter 3 1 n=1 Tax=Quillaja saponaria TaxID=32244 RepID=A0AAD7M4G6_QUISA|nr:sulfate transporter 3 1 [Quillaja saponaria]
MGTTTNNRDDHHHTINFSAPRGFSKKLKSNLKETLFPDDPFKQFKNEKPSRRVIKGIQYFVPIFGWIPNYNLRLFRYDLLAGLTITSLAIPQGISYAKLAAIPPIIGLYSSFVPPLVYAIFGSSKHMAVGVIAACSLLIHTTISEVVNPEEDPALYLHLVFTATFITGIFQAALGLLRLGILVDFLSHSTITGFMGGTAIILCLQQLKGIFGLAHFTTKTDVVSVIGAIIANRHEIKWITTLLGVVFIAFLQFTKYLRKKNPKLFWVSAMAPMVTVIIGGLFAYFTHGEKHGVQIVGHLERGINPISIQYLNFNSKYLSAVARTGIITGFLSLAEGISIGSSFAVMKNEQIDGNKEMVAFGLMNLFGSFTSCYLTSGPFSKTAVNFNAGCRTAMSNIVQAVFMALTLLFLAPLFRYTPLVALSAIIMSAMLGLIDYEEAIHLFKVDKFDFLICMACFFGVSFLSMDVGLLVSVGLGLLRALLYVSRPATCKLGKLQNSSVYRDMEQYPDSTQIPGILILQLGSPIYFANSKYIKERILRWIRDEQSISLSKSDLIEHVLLDFTGVTSIDTTGIEGLIETRRLLEGRGIKMAIVNPRIDVMEKMMASHFVDKVGKESFFLNLDDAVGECQYSLHKSQPNFDVEERGFA